MPWSSQRTSKHSFCLLGSLVPSVVVLLKSHPSTPDSKDVAVLLFSYFRFWPQGLQVGQLLPYWHLTDICFPENQGFHGNWKKTYRWTLAEQTFSCVSALDLIWWPPGPSESVLCAWQYQGSLWDSEVLLNHASWLDLKRKSLSFRCKGGAGAFSKLPFTNLFLVITSVTFQNPFLKEFGAFEPARSLN